MLLSEAGKAFIRKMQSKGYDKETIAVFIAERAFEESEEITCSKCAELEKELADTKETLNNYLSTTEVSAD